MDAAGGFSGLSRRQRRIRPGGGGGGCRVTWDRGSRWLTSRGHARQPETDENRGQFSHADGPLNLQLEKGAIEWSAASQHTVRAQGHPPAPDWMQYPERCCDALKTRSAATPARPQVSLQGGMRRCTGGFIFGGYGREPVFPSERRRKKGKPDIRIYVTTNEKMRLSRRNSLAG